MMASLAQLDPHERQLSAEEPSRERSSRPGCAVSITRQWRCQQAAAAARCAAERSDEGTTWPVQPQVFVTTQRFWRAALSLGSDSALVMRPPHSPCMLRWFCSQRSMTQWHSGEVVGLVDNIEEPLLVWHALIAVCPRGPLTAATRGYVCCGLDLTYLDSCVEARKRGKDLVACVSQSCPSWLFSRDCRLNSRREALAQELPSTAGVSTFDTWSSCSLFDYKASSMPAVIATAALA